MKYKISCNSKGFTTTPLFILCSNCLKIHIVWEFHSQSQTQYIWESISQLHNLLQNYKTCNRIYALYYNLSEHEITMDDWKSTVWIFFITISASLSKIKLKPCSNTNLKLHIWIRNWSKISTLIKSIKYINKEQYPLTRYQHKMLRQPIYNDLYKSPKPQNTKPILIAYEESYREPTSIGERKRPIPPPFDPATASRSP